MINEDFLYYIWQNRLLLKSDLRLTNGDQLEILHPGYRNFESGPDYFNARLRIDNMIWAGNVEIHTKSSDWYKHHHTGDLSYDNIILHAVQTEDVVIRRMDGSPIPTLVMNGCYPQQYVEQHAALLQSNSPFIPCSRQLHHIPSVKRAMVLDRMLTERLETRFNDLEEIYLQCGKSWPEAFYRILARAFGFKINAIPFELLVKSLPYEMLMRHRQQPEDLEAFLYGQAGLLPPQPSDPYAERLKRQYRFFRHKYHLQPLSPHLWKFGGLRPVNFPTLRISQFAQLHNNHEYLLDRIISSIELIDLVTLLDINASDYWYQHYRFGVSSESYAKKLGKDAIHTLIINAIIPFLFFYGRKQQIPILCDKAIYWMEKCPPENNRIIRMFQDAGWYAGNSGQTQGQLHLKKNYCDYKKCVNCGIGQQLLQQHAASN
jgi:hypothetical protein